MIFRGLILLIVFLIEASNAQQEGAHVLCRLVEELPLSKQLATGDMSGWECVDGQPSGLCEEWSGIKCDRKGRVKYLDVSHQRLSGTIPSVIGDINHLEQLYLDFNQFHGEIPSSLSKLTRLSALSLQHNLLSGTIPSEVGEMTKLKSLHLDHNKLSGPIPPSLGKLPLADLTASYNSLSGSLPSSLGRISRDSRAVDFSYNQLQGTIPVELCLARNLFLVSNSISNTCNDICQDKRYREGSIHIASKGNFNSKSSENQRRIQEHAEKERENEEYDYKEMEMLKKNLRNMVNL